MPVALHALCFQCNDISHCGRRIGEVSSATLLQREEVYLAILLFRTTLNFAKWKARYWLHIKLLPFCYSIQKSFVKLQVPFSKYWLRKNISESNGTAWLSARGVRTFFLCITCRLSRDPNHLTGWRPILRDRKRVGPFFDRNQLPSPV